MKLYGADGRRLRRAVGYLRDWVPVAVEPAAADGDVDAVATEELELLDEWDEIEQCRRSPTRKKQKS